MNTPETVQFVSDHVRPLAEFARDFIIRATPVIQKWSSIEPLLGNDDAVIEDERGAEGVQQLTCGQVRAFINIISGLNFAGTFDVISTPCVREPLNLD